MKTHSQANRGKPFEDFLMFVHDRYQHDGTACVHKVPTEFIPLRDATGRVCSVKVERKSCVDYLGRYKSTPVAIEAKHTEEERIALSRVEPHQADYMDAYCSDPGAVGIVLVSFSLRRFFAVPWPFWREAREAWGSERRKKPSARGSVPVHAYGWFWDTPCMASLAPDQLLPEWEIKAGGKTGLPYLEIIDRMERS